MKRETLPLENNDVYFTNTDISTITYIDTDTFDKEDIKKEA